MTKHPSPRKERAAGRAAEAPGTAAVQSNALEAIALGELTPDDSLRLIRAALDQADAHAIQRTYEALRSLAWKKLAERVVGSEMRPWYDVFRQAAALLEVLDAHAQSQKIAAFAELAIESVRFGQVNSSAEMQRRAHVREILFALSNRGGTALRSAVLSETGLKQANFSRVLAHMASAGFIDRRSNGREVVLSLTSLGREAISSPPRHGPTALVVFPPLDDDGPSPQTRRARA